MADDRRIRIYHSTAGFAGQKSLRLDEFAALTSEQATEAGGYILLGDSSQGYAGQQSMTVDEFIAHITDIAQSGARDARRVWLYPAAAVQAGFGSMPLAELVELAGGGVTPDSGGTLDFSNPANSGLLIFVGL